MHRIDAEYLLGDGVSGLNRASYLHVYDGAGDRKMLTERLSRVLIKMRAAHEPLQYITGEQEFMGLSFHS